MSKRKWEISQLNGRTIAVDLDGVLADYPGHYIDWVKRNLTVEEKHAVAEKEAQGNLGLYALKNALSFNAYRTLKATYRELHEKEAPALKGARDFLELWRKLAQVVIITARPEYEYQSCSKDTREWLRKNNLPYDHILFSRHKHVEVLQRFPHTLFMVEDHRYLANLVAQWGYDVFLINTEYNMGETLPKVRRVDSLADIRAEGVATSQAWNEHKLGKEHVRPVEGGSE